jgi:hypothetical protein
MKQRHSLKKMFLFTTILHSAFVSHAIEVRLSQPPTDYRVYSWDATNRTVKHVDSSKSLETISVNIPDEFVQGLDPAKDLNKILERWRHNTPISSTNPRTKNGIGFYPFTDQNGKTRFIALEYLNERANTYPHLQYQYIPSGAASKEVAEINESPETPVISEVEKETPPPVHAKQRSGNILYIGDSHSVNNNLRNTLVSELSKNGDAVSYYASCGSNAAHWSEGNYKSNCGNYNSSRTPVFNQLLTDKKPATVIINLGDNLFSWKGKNPRRAEGISQQAKNDMKKLVKNISSSTSCYWVGPTWRSLGSSYFKSDEMVNKMYAALKENVGSKCTIVDCRSAVPRTSKGDGLHHHSKEASNAWAQCIAEKTKSSPAIESSDEALSIQ